MTGGQRLSGLFVTGTDTGAGKTLLAAAIASALRVRGAQPMVLKPLLTGTEEVSDPRWPADDELLGQAAGVDPQSVTLRRYGPPVSPHLAAALAGDPIDGEELVRAIRNRAAAASGAPVVIEGVGGLLVPLGAGWDVRRLAVALGLPVLIAARPGLGTINHTLLTLEAARSAGLSVAGVVLTPWPAQPSTIEHSNRATIERRGDVEVSILAEIRRADRALLAQAGEQLPLERWLSAGGPSAGAS